MKDIKGLYQEVKELWKEHEKLMGKIREKNDEVSDAFKEKFLTNGLSHINNWEFAIPKMYSDCTYYICLTAGPLALGQSKVNWAEDFKYVEETSDYDILFELDGARIDIGSDYTELSFKKLSDFISFSSKYKLQLPKEQIAKDLKNIQESNSEIEKYLNQLDL